MTGVETIYQVEHLASAGSWEEITSLLQSRPELATAEFGEAESTLLISLASFENVEVIKALLAIGADPNYVDRGGQSALLSTVWGAVEGRNTFSVLATLLEHGANPEIIVQSGVTATEIAKINALQGYADLMQSYQKKEPIRG